MTVDTERGLVFLPTGNPADSLQRIDEQRMLQALNGKPRSTGTSGLKSRKAAR
jgi:hypothetical protein